MTDSALFRGPVGRLVAALTCLVVMAGLAPRSVAQSSSSAMVQGVVLDPAGAPAKGFRVVFRDMASNTRYSSTLTDAQGNYIVELPLGSSYKIDSVIADDAVTKLPIEDIDPFNVTSAGPLHMNVRFTSGNGTKTAGEAESKRPWYKRPGPIVGMVVVAVGIAALVAGGSGGSSSEASPFTVPPADK